MPSSQNAATERRNDRMISHEPPKLKTTLKTSPKQATNPLQFVKVGPCSLYRTAQEQLQKVQEVKKVKQEVRDDPEDWQSNLDNWKSSRRKRQEHIIERVVEVKKLELEEHDRHRRRSKTFSEMMEERSSRGRKLSMSLAMYHEEDSNDLSDLGIGTSSGKSSVSGDTHDDTQSVLSDRDSEIDKNHSDLDNASHENGNTNENNNMNAVPLSVTSITKTAISKKSPQFGNGFQDDQREYDSGTTATTSSPEPDEYNYEGAIRYNRAPPQTLPRTSLLKHDPKLDSKPIINYEETAGGSDKSVPVVKVDVLKRREIFEKAAQKTADNKVNNNGNRSSGEFSSPVSIKERLMSLEKQTIETAEDEDKNSKVIDRLSGDMTTIRERLSFLEKQVSVRETKISSRKLSNDEFEPVRPLRERLSTLEKYASSDDSSSAPPLPPVKPQPSPRQHVEFTTKVKDRLCILDSTRTSNNHNNIINNNNNDNDNNVNTNNNNNNIKDVDKKPVDKPMLRFNNRERNETSTPSERSSSPDSEYRAPRATFHQSLDSLDADASSEPDTFDRVQSLEELDYVRRRYPTSVSSAEILNDTDREDSGIHTADVSCSVSQADEPVDEEVAPVHHGTSITIEVKPPVPKDRSIKGEDDDLGDKVTAECNQIKASEDFQPEADQEKDVQLESAVIIEESIVIDGSSSDEETELQCKSTESVEHEEEARASEPLTSGNQSAELPLTCPNIEAVTNAASPVIVVDQEIYQDSQSESVASSTPLSYETESNISDYDKPPVVSPLTMEFIDPSMSLSKSIYQLNLSNDEKIEIISPFPLGPPSSVEPPKEKPPPPPIDYSDDENQPTEPLKRLNSTRRIKKELRTRRSDFLGLEGVGDDELHLEVPKPLDMTALLAEERRIEQMNRRSYDTDSNYEQDSIHDRDSGVGLGHAEDWTKQAVSPDMSQHSRQSSEPFGASVTSSEEDEITKKEREIFEMLEKEEQWRYGNDREQNSDIGEKLAHKLRELEEEKMQLERERAQESVALHRQDEPLRKTEEIQPRMQEEDLLRNQQQLQHLHHHQQQQQEIIVMQSEVIREEEIEFREQEKLRFDVERLKLHEDIYDQERRNEIRRQDEMHLRAIDRKIREPEHTVVNAVMCDHDDEYASGEVLRVERELLQLEQEALKRQRSNMVYREQKQQQLAEQWQSLQNVNYTGNIVHATYQNIDMTNYRSSMPNLQLQENQRRRPAPPPIPPAKPLRLIDQRQRDMTIRNSRIPSADSIPQQVDATIRHSASATALSTHAGQQMTKQTLNALSAVPRTRIVKNDQWVQRRKSDGPRVISQDLNYQHWLIQEAEQRRINEKNQRSPPQRKPQQHVTGTSVPYTASTTSYKSEGKPLPDSIIQTLTQRIQNRAQERPMPLRRRIDHSVSQEHLPQAHHQPSAHLAMMHQKAHQSPGTSSADSQEKLLSVSGKKKCSHCGDELGRGAAMIIESLRLFYHMECFKCCVCHVRLGDGLMGTDVRVRNHKLHCHNCYSSDDGVKFSCV